MATTHYTCAAGRWETINAGGANFSLWLQARAAMAVRLVRLVRSVRAVRTVRTARAACDSSVF